MELGLIVVQGFTRVLGSGWKEEREEFQLCDRRSVMGPAMMNGGCKAQTDTLVDRRWCQNAENILRHFLRVGKRRPVLCVCIF